MQGRWAPLAASLTSSSSLVAVAYAERARSLNHPLFVLFNDKLNAVRYQRWRLPRVTRECRCALPYTVHAPGLPFW